MYSQIENGFKQLTLVILTLGFILTGCEDSDDDNTGMGPTDDLNVVERIATNDELSTLAETVTAAGLADDLQASGPFTVLAPSNDAFSRIPADTLAALTDEELVALLSYHVVPAAIGLNDIDPRQVVPTLEGEQLLLTRSGDLTTINNEAVIESYLTESSNGFVHIIDEVLLPKGFRPPNIIDQAENLGRFTSLVDAIGSGDLRATLKYQGSFTVFAPNDAAFDALQDGLLASLSDEDLAEILQYHVLSGEVLSTNIQPDQTAPSLTGEQLYLESSNGVRVNGSASVVTPDVEVSNGVIHEVDQVLLPDRFQNVVEMATKRYQLSTLVSAIQRVGLGSTLSDADSEFTIFAPLNSGFENVDLNSLSDQELREILTYHAVDGTILSSQLAASQSVETLQGEDLLITLEDGTVEVNNRAVVASADIRGTNGVIHIVDDVLLPSDYREPNIVDVAVDLGNFTTLTAALDQTGLQTTIAFEGPFTVFAPTDAAFNALPDGLLESLSNEQLAEILQYHVLSGEVASTDLTAQQAPASLTGESLFIESNNGVTVNGTAMVRNADVDATNGVIHAVDEVLLPDAYVSSAAIIQKRYNLSTLLDAIGQADLLSTFQATDTDLTIFAPSNTAFERVDLSGLSQQELADILTYHVVAGSVVTSGDITDTISAETLNGASLTVEPTTNGGVAVNGSQATVVTADIEGVNCVIHIIDGVLDPTATE